VDVRLRRYLILIAVYFSVVLIGLLTYKLSIRNLIFTEGEIVLRNERPVIRFLHDANVYEVKFSSLERHQKGDLVRLVFNPAEPENARLYNFYDYWLIKLSLFALALMFSTGLVVFYFRLKEIR